MRRLMIAMMLVGTMALAEEPSIPMLLTAKEKAWVDRKRIPVSVIIAQAQAAQAERIAKMSPAEKAEYERVAALSPAERRLEMEKQRLSRLTNEVATVQVRITDMTKAIEAKPVEPIVKPIAEGEQPVGR